MQKRTSNSVKETESIAEEYAASSVEPGDIICLHGDLGAGKTQFVKGFVRAFGLSGNEVNSPTFTIINEYEGSLPIFHFDCYRLEHEEEALEIGAEEYFYGNGVCIIEWPERILSVLPESRKEIHLKHKAKNRREIIFQ
jgi:tRNA threonylcarbamoyladenosine biosynthesis protein TsaE